MFSKFMQHTTSCVLECGEHCPCSCHNEPAITDIEKQFLQESNKIEGVFDIASLDQAIVAWLYLREQKKLLKHNILKAHKLLMLNQPGLYPNEKGYFRTIPVYIAGRKCEVINADGWPLETVISQWCHQANQTAENWKEHHVVFEKIHPFVDGNGRIGRMLMNWQRLKGNLPILVINSNDRQSYYEWFK